MGLPGVIFLLILVSGIILAQCEGASDSRFPGKNEVLSRKQRNVDHRLPVKFVPFLQ